jgi:diguanylate cyclase (GGDEF)-like protein
VTVDPILDDRNTLLGSVAVLHNVTAQKAAERSAREEAKISDLLQGIAVAANNAHNVRDAFQVCLDRVCEFMRWPIGHVYVKQGDVLKSSGWWHDANPARFAGFRDLGSTLQFAPDMGMIGQVLSSGLATWLVDLKSDSGYVHPEAAAEVGLVSGFAFPVLVENEVVAALEFYSERKEEADPRLLGLMANIGTQLGRVIERERARKAIEEQADRVRSLSVRDELTELHNRRGFLELAKQQLRLAERTKRPSVLFFFDLNGMKPINDELGHEEGDRALREIADVLRIAFRASDIVARLGGDEFVALLPDAERWQIDLFVNRIEAEVARRNLESGRKFELSVSIGGCAFDPSHPESIEELLVKADALMYEQKRAHKRRSSSQPSPGSAPDLSGSPRPS